LAHQWRLRQVQTFERQKRELLANYHPPVQVLAATKDLSEGVTIDPSLITTISVPEKFVQPYAARTPNEILGLVTVAPIAEGEQLLANKLRRPEAGPVGATLSRVMPKGKRAVTIGVDSISGVGGFVRPGDTVDVLWSVKVGGRDGENSTLTLFQDVPVLAVGRDVMGKPTQERETQNQYTVTMAMSPQETSFLLFARDQGHIQLSLRPQVEEAEQVAAVVPANNATFAAFMQSQLGIQPDPAAKPSRQVELYRGLERDVVLLSEGQ
jgi:pilus assembly protein CpaB